MRFVTLLLIVGAIPVHADDLGLKVPPNFRVTLWADHTLANDISTMAIDEKGRIVVSGPGYIRRLEDTDGDGKADKATDIAETKTGAMGICYRLGPNDSLGYFFSADSQINEQSITVVGETFDQTHRFFGNWTFGEHGGHALRIGPDGALYAICGNSTLAAANEKPAKPFSTQLEGGALFRFSLHPTVFREPIAHGFRNPYDFDFTPYGDIITFDSDTERDYGLPWYSPTRVYHVMPGAHHGWRLSGGMRSLARRDYYPDTVPILADMGRGSPTGVCCYRHTQFPEHYRGGVFLLDWTFGKVHYLPLIPEGSSYKHVRPVLFLESTGTNGFAPTAARVGPDGSLFISIGGRGTRGGVYRIEYLVDGKNPPIPMAEPEKDIDKVLDAPQPLEAWSMAKWRPLSKGIAPREFFAVASDESETDARRIRALECLVSEGVDLSGEQFDALAKSQSSAVRARTAWAMGRIRIGARKSLRDLSNDAVPRVAVAAIEAIGRQLVWASSPNITLDEAETGLSIERIANWLSSPDQRTRLAASNVVRELPGQWTSILEKRILAQRSARSLSAYLSALTNRHGLSRPEVLYSVAIELIDNAKSERDKLDTVRTIMQGLGDWKIYDPSLELLSAYTLKYAPTLKPGFVRLLTYELLEKLRAWFPSNDETLNIELSRLMAMLSDENPGTVVNVLSRITTDSHPTSDFHYLTVLTRLTAPRKQSQSEQVASALFTLNAKLARHNLRVESNWAPRLRELVHELLRRHPGLDKLLVAHDKVVSPGHIAIVSQFRLEARRAAALRFLDVIREDPEFPLSPELVQLLSTLPSVDVRPVLRSRWADRPAREAIVRQLATKPEEVDRGKFLEVLETASTDVAAICSEALATLPRDPSPRNLVPLYARLRLALSDSKEAGLRKKIVALLERQRGESIAVEEGKTPLAEVYEPLFSSFGKAHPKEAKRLSSPAEDEAAVRQLAATLDWGNSNVARGVRVFDKLGCQACHGNTTRLGPSLVGSSKRMSRDDLLTAILNPSRDVSPAYRVTNIDTKDGKRTSGIIVYDSTETLLVQLGNGETKRIPTSEVEARSPSTKSLMPDGLLKGIKPEDLADLFALLTRQ